MPQVADPVTVDATHLHTDQGVVWAQTGTRPPCNTGLSVAEFLTQAPLARASARVLGCRENAPLIVFLYQMRARGRLASVQVASPLVGRITSERENPAWLLNRMRTFRQRQSLGGWHEVGEVEILSYILATLFQKGEHHHTLELLCVHPAWSALEFIPHLDAFKAAELLSLILDPRWYIDPEKPNRSGKLHRHLGLYPAAITAIRRGRVTTDPVRRCKLALECWKTAEGPGEAAADGTPGYFLWRRWSARYDNSEIADLRTTQALMTYIRLNWLDGLYRARAIGAGKLIVGDGLFVPEYFFQDKAEVDAFYAHRQRCDARIRTTTFDDLGQG